MESRTHTSVIYDHAGASSCVLYVAKAGKSCSQDAPEPGVRGLAIGGGSARWCSTRWVPNAENASSHGVTARVPTTLSVRFQRHPSTVHPPAPSQPHPSKLNYLPPRILLDNSMSSETGPSRKRPRVDEADLSAGKNRAGDGDLERVPQKDRDVWLSDGNIVVIARGEVAFRIHPSILSLRSEVFSPFPMPARVGQWRTQARKRWTELPSSTSATLRTTSVAFSCLFAVARSRASCFARARSSR